MTSVITSLGYSKGNIERWRNGSYPTGDTLIEFANYFNVSIDYLLTGREIYMENKGVSSNDTKSFLYSSLMNLASCFGLVSVYNTLHQDFDKFLISESELRELCVKINNAANCALINIDNFLGVFKSLKNDAATSVQKADRGVNGTLASQRAEEAIQQESSTEEIGAALFEVYSNIHGLDPKTSLTPDLMGSVIEFFAKKGDVE